eukprot:scaffold6.g2686.t1
MDARNSCDLQAGSEDTSGHSSGEEWGPEEEEEWEAEDAFFAASVADGESGSELEGAIEAECDSDTEDEDGQAKAGTSAWAPVLLSSRSQDDWSQQDESQPESKRRRTDVPAASVCSVLLRRCFKLDEHEQPDTGNEQDGQVQSCDEPDKFQPCCSCKVPHVTDKPTSAGALALELQRAILIDRQRRSPS